MPRAQGGQIRRPLRLPRPDLVTPNSGATRPGRPELKGLATKEVALEQERGVALEQERGGDRVARRKRGVGGGWCEKEASVVEGRPDPRLPDDARPRGGRTFGGSRWLEARGLGPTVDKREKGR
ncbi:hypothetical protein E2562_033373 [Oryza meyeriana var. granulata]|uniref:DUF834 domain-containing protein n=1 Tax=Oryza meyeriana var. granulata TaxID=110450 RepID=A0A6G1C012_9ORYZ|nr:hypothetical protein E2562_033373 [Oryza meyeriana var. granulata]